MTDNLIKTAITNPQAFEELYKKTFVPLFRYVYFRVKNKEIAEDLLQTVFIKAWQKITSLNQQNDNLLPWLYTIARNTVIDYYRKPKPLSLDAFENHNFATHSLNIDERLDQQDKLKKVLANLSNLSSDQQEVIILRFINDLTYKEISHILNKKEEAIRALQYRALKSLKQTIQNEAR